MRKISMKFRQIF